MFSSSRSTTADLRCAWRLSLLEGASACPGPKYRGAFEPTEKSPRYIRLGVVRESALDCTARFCSTGIFRGGIPFAVSVDIDPEIWKLIRQSRAWYFFRSDQAMLGLWCSLPATWLAQKSDGSPMPPPWRELWSFGTNHIWAGRIGPSGDFEGFIESCLSRRPKIPPIWRRSRIHVAEALDLGLEPEQE